jgi:hypothetical protein
MEDWWFTIAFMFISTLIIIYGYVIRTKIDKLQKEVEWLKKKLS